MRKLIASATFVALGLGTAIAGAQNMAGSDTLNGLVNELVDGIAPAAPVCTAAAAITYIAGGSGAGENAIIANPPTNGQSVAPMSRFLGASAAVCGANAGDTTKAEGIAIAVDGLSVVASTGLNETHRVACDPLAQQGSSSTCTTNTAAGLANAGGDWRRVLRVVYFGLEGATPAAAPSAVDPNTRACNGSERTTTVNTWGSLYANGCTTTDCAQLRHAFRRDENSGTTDVFRELLRVNGGAQTGNAGMPFCNEYVPGNGAAPSQPPALVGGTIVGQPGLPQLIGANQPGYYELYQDSDPIRRACLGTNNNANPLAPSAPSQTANHEQVCGSRGTLGLVLPISVPQEKPVDQIYSVLPCSQGAAALAPAYQINSGMCNGAIGARYLLCPNGGLPQGASYDAALGVACGGTGSCYVPVNTATAGVINRACLNGKNNFGVYNAPPGGPAIPIAEQDGRVWNLYPRTQAGAPVTQSYRVNGVAGERLILGAFYRLHSSRTAVVPTSGTIASGCADGVCCQETDSTRQIGCLVQASPCSLGFAGREADTVVLDTNQKAAGTVYGAYGLTVNGVNPVSDVCLTSATYPLSRLLYANTVKGFDTASAAELALVQCMAGTQGQGLLSKYDFLALPTGPCCNDFGDDAANTLCPNTVDACADNAALSLPTAHCSVP